MGGMNIYGVAMPVMFQKDTRSLKELYNEYATTAISRQIIYHTRHCVRREHEDVVLCSDKKGGWGITREGSIVANLGYGFLHVDTINSEYGRGVFARMDLYECVNYAHVRGMTLTCEQLILMATRRSEEHANMSKRASMEEQSKKYPVLRDLLDMSQVELQKIFHKYSYFTHVIDVATHLNSDTQHSIETATTFKTDPAFYAGHNYGITNKGRVVVHIEDGWFMPYYNPSTNQYSEANYKDAICEAVGSQRIMMYKDIITMAMGIATVDSSMNEKPMNSNEPVMTLKELFELNPSTREEMYDGYNKSFRIRTFVYAVIGDGAEMCVDSKLLVWGDKTFGIDNCGGIFVAFNGNFTDINSIYKAYPDVTADQVNTAVCDLIEKNRCATIPQLIAYAREVNIKPVKPKKRKYRVWIEQVNQTYIDVVAKDEDHARTKAYAEWRKGEGHSSISDVKEIDE